MDFESTRAIPEPHILDHDWRYTRETVLDLSVLASPLDAILAVGTPSVARLLESRGYDVLLIDRQPFHAVRNQIRAEPGSDVPDFEKRATAFVDPPWYPSDAKIWIAWVANRIGPNGKMFVSLWPDDTRPTASEEFSELKSWISAWADVEVLNIIPKYDMPPFESSALLAIECPSSGLSPRHGRLISINIRSLPELLSYRQPRHVWNRFVINDYQVAIRLGKGTTPKAVEQHPRAEKWIWPYVSQRTPGRELINLWTSQNEVALLGDPNAVSDTLRKALTARDAGEFHKHLGSYAKLLELKIPRPPYRRLFEWQHLQ